MSTKEEYSRINMKDTNKEKVVFRAVLKATGVSRRNLVNRPRGSHASKLVHATKYLLWKHTKLTQQEIAEMFGYKEHSTTNYSINVVRDLIGFDDELTNKIKRIERRIQA